MRKWKRKKKKGQSGVWSKAGGGIPNKRWQKCYFWQFTSKTLNIPAQRAVWEGCMGANFQLLLNLFPKFSAGLQFFQNKHFPPCAESTLPFFFLEKRTPFSGFMLQWRIRHQGITDQSKTPFCHWVGAFPGGKAEKMLRPARKFRLKIPQTMNSQQTYPLYNLISLGSRQKKRQKSWQLGIKRENLWQWRCCWFIAWVQYMFATNHCSVLRGGTFANQNFWGEAPSVKQRKGLGSSSGALSSSSGNPAVEW